MRAETHHNVFDHNVDPGRLEGLRTAVIDDIYDLLGNPMPIKKVHLSDFSSDKWLQIRERYCRLIMHGSLNKRPLADELIWKWTESTGKYLGCPFWSLKAKELFERESPSDRTQKKTIGRLSQKKRPKEMKLTHEHVYPRKQLLAWLQDQKGIDRRELRVTFERICIGCVVLESEHDLASGDGDFVNPWLRYKRAGIALAYNSAWPDSQKFMIEEAGLI